MKIQSAYEEDGIILDNHWVKITLNDGTVFELSDFADNGKSYIEMTTDNAILTCPRASNCILIIDRPHVRREREL